MKQVIYNKDRDSIILTGEFGQSLWDWYEEHKEKILKPGHFYFGCQLWEQKRVRVGLNFDFSFYWHRKFWAKPQYLKWGPALILGPIVLRWGWDRQWVKHKLLKDWSQEAS